MEGFTTKKQQFATVWKMHTAGDAQWYPAQVPGTVYTDLLRNGQMEDPFWKDNEYRALDLMEKDYEYETVFEGTEAQEGERQWLRFEGLDTICDIYLNEEKIGNTYNMHRTWEFDVTGKVKAGENILRVYFHSPLEYIKEAYEKQPTHVQSRAEVRLQEVHGTDQENLMYKIGRASCRERVSSPV